MNIHKSAYHTFSIKYMHGMMVMYWYILGICLLATHCRRL